MDILAMGQSPGEVIAELNAKVFIAHAEALEKLGLWGVFASHNGGLLRELEEKLELKGGSS